MIAAIGRTSETTKLSRPRARTLDLIADVAPRMTILDR